MEQQATYLDRSDTHVLVIDDDDRIRDLLSRYLGRAGYRVSSAKNAADARAKMAGIEYDLLIVDVMMPGEDGVSLVADLRGYSDIPVILLTALGDPAHRIRGLKAGADDYLPKPFEPEELLLRMDAIFRRTGRKTVSDKISFGELVYDLKQSVLTRRGEVVRLTTSETTLLDLLARQGGGTVSRYVLSENVNGESERAVDVQMTRLRRKLEENPSEPCYLLTVRGKGYRLVAEPESEH
ncbi:DNA-binding response regulator [Algimonas arctica]|uniref:DNA-binding response regulator n=1 Tax=Algimonas arctica TaxID=1479486 RepID=A0A8J3CRP4_9PROT|nr:response regulator transcription factor [Algimonas arctica]GHA91032.1 DNA-binding response regulator [Algimonas arctica]